MCMVQKTFQNVVLKVIVSSLVWFAGSCYATTYTNYINESSWSTSGSVFKCEMVHSIPYFGDAVFMTRAGESSAFFLDGMTSRFRKGEAAIIAKPPVWRSDQRLETLGFVPVKQAKKPMHLKTRRTEEVLAQLYKGMDIELKRRAWYEASNKPSAKVIVSTIGFQEVYKQYLECLASLLPANFDQLKRTSLYFSPPGSTDLTADSYKKLDHIIELVKHDKTIKKFYIDGHASSPGDRSENLELSKSRAEEVSLYLQEGGIPKDQIVVRWHGERYPIASNNSRGGRSKNRRVTVRLEKVFDEAKTMAAAN